MKKILHFFSFIFERIIYSMSNDDEYMKYNNIHLQNLDGLSYEDFYSPEDEEPEEVRIIYPNPTCEHCEVEMFTLVSENIPKFSVCHKCNKMIKH